MNIQQLLYISEVHKCGSISKAASNLYMAQPNLSNSIKELEREIGVTIFDRSPKGVTTTAEGLEFIRHANDIITRMNALENYYQHKTDSVLRLSITTMRSSVICHHLISYLESIQDDDRSYQINFREATNFEVINDVESGRSDFGIIRSNDSNFSYFSQLAQSRECTVTALPAAKYSILLSQEHPLVHNQELTADMLIPYPEVIHGDFEIPMYPYSSVYAKDINDDGKKIIFVYDRASLLDIIAISKQAYCWTTSTHPSILDAYKLKEINCVDGNMRAREALIYRKNSIFSDDMLRFIFSLTTEDRE